MIPTQQKQPNRPALGKGLASLLPGANANPAALAKQIMGEAAVPPPPGLQDQTANKERIPGITMAEVDQIITNQYQPRRDFSEPALADMAESVRAHGIIQPLVVRRGEDGKLHLIAGERRLRAAKMVGLKQVPIVIRKATDKENLELALIENIQREDLNCVEVALSYFQLGEDFRLTQEEIAKRVGKDRVSVANHLRILKLPEAFLDDLRKGVLSFGHGRALLAVTDPVKRLEFRNRIVEKQLSVRETEKMVADSLLNAEPKEEEKKEINPAKQELKAFSERLGRVLGTRVKTKGDQYRGAIVIDFFSKEDLERISEQLLR